MTDRDYLQAMHKNHRTILQIVGSAEFTFTRAIHQLSEMDYVTCHYAIKGCKAHKWITWYQGMWELTDKGLRDYV